MKRTRQPAISSLKACWPALLLTLGLLLTACDNASESATKNSTATTEKSTAPAANKTDATTLEQLKKRSEGKALVLQDAAELQLDGASALVLTFSVPLDPKQDFSNQVHVVDSVNGKLDGGWELSENLTELRLRHLQPERELLLTVDAGVRALNGAQLADGSKQTIKTRNISPSIGFASKGSLLPTKLAQGLPVMTLNVNHVDVNFFRVKPDQLPNFLAVWQYNSALNSWDAESYLGMAELAYSGRFDLNPAANTRERVLLPLNNIKELQQTGVYLAVMQQAGSYSTTLPATLFTLSDIGVSLHSYRDRLDVFAQALENGSALKDVQLTLLDAKGQTLAEGKTDSQGHGQLLKSDKAKLLLATQNDQTSLIDLTTPALDLAEFDIAGQEGYSKQFFAFGPRDLYRPGETLLVNGLLRDADGKALPSQPVKVDILRPDNQVVRSFVWQPQDGLYQYQYAIPAAGPTGNWSLRFNLGDNQPRLYTFKVEDFLPERMALLLENRDTPLAPSDSAEFSVTGRYLYGAPASGNSLQGQLFLRPQREAVAKLPGFEFGSITEENLSRKLDEFDVTLDEQGKATIAEESQWETVRSPLNLILQASLLESGGRPVSRRAEQAIWPAEKLVGIRPLFEKKQIYDYRANRYQTQAVVPEDSQAAFELVYADISGKKLAANGLKVQLIRERRDYYWEWSSSEGWQSLFDKKDLPVATQDIDIKADANAKVSFPVEWGAYRLEVTDPQNELVSSLRFWAGYSWQDNSDGSGAQRPDQVKLKLDKAAYRTGEKAKVQIDAPAAGKGYLLVESSEGPLWWQEIDVPANGLQVDVPINKEWRRHDLYLSALVIRPGDKQQQSTPKRAVGLLHLPLADENRKLTLDLTAPERIRPNQNLTVKIKASRQGGELPKQVNVLLSAVDSGILSITDYVTPDPYDAFFGRKRYSADQYDVYGQLIEAKGRLGNLRFGGDAGEDDSLSRGGKKPITDVIIVAQQAQPVTLDANGEGSISLAIPEFNGELRLMAQAWSDEDFGKAETKVVVAAPVIAELNTPRFMAGGDVSELALDISNLSGQQQALTLTLVSSGLTRLQGQNHYQVTLAQGARKTFRIPVTALNGFGQGQVSLNVTGLQLPGESLNAYQRSWKIGVRPAYPAVTRQFSAVLHNGEQWRLPENASAGLTPETVEGKLLLTSRPPINLARYISELYAYPYGCLEQTTSGLYPSLYTTKAQLDALGIKTSSDEQRRQTVDTGIEHLLSMQRHNGGFGLWSRDSSEEFWLTAYATDFLFRASEQGYAVPADALTAANNRLLRYLQDSGQIDIRYSQNLEQSRLQVQAYAGFVLARQQKAPLGALRDVVRRMNAESNGLSKVQLGIALRLMGDIPRGDKAIAEGIAANSANRLSNWADYGSPVRDDAMILALLNEYSLLPDDRDRRLLILSQQLNGRSYLSTQESNALFLAGRQLLGSQESPWQVVISGNNTPVESRRAVTQSLDAQQLNGAFDLTNQGNSTVYSRLDLVGYPQNPPMPSSNVLTIKRKFMDINGQPLDMSNLSSGQLVLVNLDVSASQAIPDALVVDLLPAGLELENQNLANSSASLAQSSDAVAELLQDMQQADIKHQEFRDDRYVAAVNLDGYRHTQLLYLARAVTPGSYRVPAPQVESMYVPEWRATGGTPGRLEIHR